MRQPTTTKSARAEEPAIMLDGPDVQELPRQLDYAAPEPAERRGGRTKNPAPREGGAGGEPSVMNTIFVIAVVPAAILLISVGWGEAGFSSRFRDDNAVAATANASEQLTGLGKVAVGVLLLIFATGVRIYGVVRAALRRG